MRHGTELTPLAARSIAAVLVCTLATSCGVQAPAAEARDAEVQTDGHVPAVRDTSRDDETIRLFRLLGAGETWAHVRTVPMEWPTFHTQGLVKVGDVFYVSSVEPIERTEPNGRITDALYDFSIVRSAGAGRGWLFKFDANGRLLGRVELTYDAAYHPGGIDFDGRHIWVPVAEYRPNSRTTIVRVDPESLEAEVVFEVPDHIGGIVHNVHSGTVHGVSWGSRRLYTWRISEAVDGVEVVSSSWTPNTQSYVAYQDCHYQGVEFMLCGGLRGYESPLGGMTLGGFDLIDLRDGRPAHQVPVTLTVDGPEGEPRVAFDNAFWVEPGGDGTLRVYLMTETDNQADLVVFEATPWASRSSSSGSSFPRRSAFDVSRAVGISFMSDT